MLAPAMRDVWQSLICRDVYMRHALRATCRTLRAWLPKDETFVRRIQVLLGYGLKEQHMQDIDAELVKLLIQKLINVDRTVYTPKNFNVTVSLSSYHAKYLIGVNHSPAKVLGTLGTLMSAFVSILLHDLYPCGFDQARNLSILLGPDMRARIFSWTLVHDSVNNNLWLYRL